MQQSAARPPDLPEDIPVFPLSGALLLPGGRLPLHIFEPRYLAMTEDALAGGRLLGMIQPDPRQPRLSSGPALYRVGCLGRVVSFSETDDGERYLITLAGLTRFAVAEELPGRRGYRRVRANFSEFAGVDLRPAAPPVIDRAVLLAALRAYFSHRGFDANWEAIDKMEDDLLVTTLSMGCPFEPAEMQALLEAPTATDRAGALLALLRIDTHSGPPEGTRPS